MRRWLSAVVLLALGITLVASGAALGQTYTLATPGTVEGVASGGTVQISLQVASLGISAKAVRWWISVDPASAFDLASTSFSAPATPTNWISPGAQVRGSAVEFGMAALGGGPITGSNSLGTATLTFAGTVGTTATITVDSVKVATSGGALAATPATLLSLEMVVNPPAPAPTVASITPAAGSIVGGTAVTIVGANFATGATVTIGGVPATGVTFVDATTIRAVAPAGAAAAAVDVVVTNTDAQAGTLTGGYAYLAVIEPTLSAVGATDVSVDYSAVGTGNAANASAGEVTLSVTFTNSTGAAAAGQAVSWAITNNGAQKVYVLGTSVTEIAANATSTVTVATGADGRSAIKLDAEGGKGAGTTTVTATATATAANSDGVSRTLARSFAATWDVPVVAELASFLGAALPGDQVVLQWTVSSQTNNLGWEIYRSQDNVTFQQVGDLVPGDGTSDELKAYTFTDGAAPAGDVLYYYLNQVDLNGTMVRSGVIQVVLSDRTSITGAQALPTANVLMQNFPNPFNPETTIAYDLTQAGTVTLTVYNVSGQAVRTLVNGEALSAGHYRSVWDGRDQSGVRVGSGVYFYVLQAPGFTSTKRMLLLQ